MAVVLDPSQCLACAIDRCEDDTRLDVRVFSALARDAELLREAVAGMSDGVELHSGGVFGLLRPFEAAKVAQKSEFCYKNAEKTKKIV